MAREGWGQGRSLWAGEDGRSMLCCRHPLAPTCSLLSPREPPGLLLLWCRVVGLLHLGEEYLECFDWESELFSSLTSRIDSGSTANRGGGVPGRGTKREGGEVMQKARFKLGRGNREPGPILTDILVVLGTRLDEARIELLGQSFAFSSSDSPERLSAQARP